MKIKKRMSRLMFFAGCFILQLVLWKTEIHAAGTLYESPYVTLSPDRTAWTVSQTLPSGTSDGRPVFWYSNGYCISTGILSSLRELQEGEHYYGVKRQGEIPIGSWKVAHTYAQCIHRLKQYPDDYLGGIVYNKTICGKPYFSGWVPFCADCGEKVTGFLYYMSKEAVASVDSIDVSLGYYYLCPSCNHLEQGIDGCCHVCKQISYNRYRIEYNENVDPLTGVTGYTDNSFHMYNNERIFEGQTVTPNTRLTLNGYQREGYSFLGWNTEPDGSGDFYADGAEILNLSTENYDEVSGRGIVTLYAQWKRIETNLIIDPNGGSYDGKTGNTVLRQQYGTMYMLKTSAITPPDGYTVTFETNGGDALPVQKSSFQFEKWGLQNPAGGVLSGERYEFRGKMNATDTIKAYYIHQPILLPVPRKANLSFGGWYRDLECTEPVGSGGDLFMPGEDTVLYAKWVELLLSAENNYNSNDGKGAVDLFWTQADDKRKSYLLYQSTDGVDFKQIYDAESATVPKLIDNTFDCNGQTRTITVPYTGFYSLTASGAQGGNYGEYKGGKGGSATGKFYLEKGEILTITVGGSDGFNGGGAATSYGNGGGYTIISSDKKGTLLIGGGGGGATSRGDGGNGGEETGLLSQDPSLLGSTGEDGCAGGGGGYQGGGKGSVSIGTEIVSTQIFYYKGEVEPYTAAEDGLYKLEVWGAQGGGGGENKFPYGADGGLGGYSAGYIELQAKQKIYVCVGGGGWGNKYKTGAGNSFNGGGGGSGSSGGGATHIASADRGTLSNYSFHQNEIYLAAGGGGGGMCIDYDNRTRWLNGGSGGGTNGGNGANSWWDTESGRVEGTAASGYGGSQTGTGTHGAGGGFGYGGYSADGGGGGGGWYGGSGAVNWNGAGAGGGGSGYIGGTPAITVDGKEYRPTTANGQRAGNGQARITQYANIVYPSYGGSNYVNTKYAVTYNREAGTGEGDGSAVVTSLKAGFQDSCSLNAVSAPDRSAPDAVPLDSINIRDIGENGISITWSKPSDNGTVYYHRVESFETETELPLCASNITKNLLTSGIAGYYYVADGQADTEVTAENALNAGKLLREEELFLASGQEMQKYLHLVVSDVAGNLSATTHVCLNDAEVAWKLFTDPLYISSEMNDVEHAGIYPADAERTWYVRADADTPFLLSFDSYMMGKAKENYQINYQFLDSRVEETGAYQRYITKLPYTVPLTASGTLDAGQFTRKTEGTGILSHAMYVSAARSDNACRNSFSQAFTLKTELHGKTITVTPAAGADFGEEVVYSDRERDSKNALHMIADGEGPVISGLEVLNGNQMIDRGDRTVHLCVSAEDAISGVGEFYMKICNTDNYGERIYQPDINGLIQADITEEDALFTGNFIVTAYAVDKVGNVSEESCRVTEFALETRVERILEPHTPAFKRGESGILYITTYGYADRVEVEFPEVLTALNQDLNTTVTYANRLYRQEERFQFMIPLAAPENDNYRITVRAYKGDKLLEEHPMFSTIKVEGSVLNELRTRLR